MSAQPSDRAPSGEEPHGNDNQGPQGSGGGPVRDTLMALRFFSRLPTAGGAHELPDLNRMAWALPFANLVIGAGPALVLAGLIWAGAPVLFASTLACLAFALVTGAMSEDALADAADGLGGGTTPAKRLAILKDSRHGTYGVLAIVFPVLLRVAALASIAAVSVPAAALCWLAATGLARSAALYPAMALPPARSDGTAASAAALRRGGLIGGCAFSAVFLVLLAGPFVGLTGIALALLVTPPIALGWTALCRRLVGGVTGDLIGALQALTEIALLTIFMMVIAGAHSGTMG